jgi:hypothetical protein
MGDEHPAGSTFVDQSDYIRNPTVYPNGESKTRYSTAIWGRFSQLAVAQA